MLREKSSRLISYLATSPKFKKTMVSMLAFTFGSSFVRNPLASIKSYDKEYDLAVIGGGSGGLATAF